MASAVHCEWPQLCHRHYGWFQERAAADYELKLSEALDAQSSSFAATHEVFRPLVAASLVCDSLVPLVFRHSKNRLER